MIKALTITSALATLLATGSCAIQRHGPDHAIYCSLGKAREGYDILCPKPVLNAGWPAPYAFDRRGISVEDKIGFPEDDFRLGPFLADMAFYMVILLGAWGLALWARRLRPGAAKSTAPH